MNQSSTGSLEDVDIDTSVKDEEHKPKAYSDIYVDLDLSSKLQQYKATVDPETESESTSTDSSDVNHSNEPKLNVMDAVCVLTTFSTAGAIVAIPWAIGQLGYILGPLLLIITVLSGVFFWNFLIDVAANSKSGRCITLGDVGYELAGRKGRIIFDLFQIGNLILYMPVALETVGLSLEYLVNGDCLGYWNIAAFAGLFLMLQICTQWNHVAWLAYVTLSIAIIKAWILLPTAFDEYQEDVVQSAEYLGPIQPFGNPSPTWSDLALAVSTFSFSFCPVFILLEVRSDMIEPSKCKKALKISAFLQVLMYLVPALICLSLWGWNVVSPVTLEIPRGWLGFLLNLVLLIAVALDFCIAAKVTNDWIKNAWFPESWKTRMESSSLCSKLFGRMAYSLPTSALALLLVLAIPNFETLIGVVTGVTIIGISNWAISLVWVMGGCRYQSNSLVMAAGFALGLPLTIWVVAAAAYEIATSDYSHGWFCSGT